jgi:glycerophosphoryl diester phosphodiesterase
VPGDDRPDALIPKLLSHRVRGFDDLEHTPIGFQRACASRASHLEIDTRVTRDGEIIVHHDAILRVVTHPRLQVADCRAQELRSLRYANSEPILFLRDALETFASRQHEMQLLCIDIKDFGFEREHVALVREAGLEDHVCFVSWIPQTIIRLSEIGVQGPLVLSYFDLHDVPLGGLLDRSIPAGPTRIWPGVVMLGGQGVTADLEGQAVGIRHFLASRGLPVQLSEILARHGGGICVPLLLARERLKRNCVNHDLALWVFSVPDRVQFERYASDDRIDVVFCDDVPRCARTVSGKRPSQMSIDSDRGATSRRRLKKPTR